jgi:hypothetical protein
MAYEEEKFLVDMGEYTEEDFTEHVEKLVKQCTFNPDFSYLRLLTPQETSEDLSLLEVDTTNQDFQEYIASCSNHAQKRLRGDANENMQAACRVIGNEFSRQVYKASREAYLRVESLRLAALPLGEGILKTFQHATDLKEKMRFEGKDYSKITQLEQKVGPLVEPLVKAYAICQAAIVVANPINLSNLVKFYQYLYPERRMNDEDVAEKIKLTALAHAQSLEADFQSQFDAFNGIMNELDLVITELESERKAGAKGGKKKTKLNRKSNKTGRKFNRKSTRKSNKNGMKFNRKSSRKSRK